MCVCVSPGNTEIPDIPLASVSQVVRPHGASQPASQLGSSIMKNNPSGPSYPPDGPVCVCVSVCERERESFYPSLSMHWWVSGVVMWLCSHVHTCMRPHTHCSKDEGFHILLKFSTRITSHRESTSSSTFGLTVIAWNPLNMGEREELSKRKNGGVGKDPAILVVISC